MIIIIIIIKETSELESTRSDQRVCMVLFSGKGEKKERAAGEERN